MEKLIASIDYVLYVLLELLDMLHLFLVARKLYSSEAGCHLLLGDASLSIQAAKSFG